MIDNDFKLGTELSLSLNVPYEERAKSLDLNVGYITSENKWELIIKYTGDLALLGGELGFQYEELFNGYAIIKIAQDNISNLIRSPQIIFVDKPKSIIAEETRIIEGFSASCMSFLISDDNTLSGDGVLVSVIDSGIYYNHPVFWSNGESRIVEIWDQTLNETPPTSGTFKEASFDSSGHGTAVASIIANCATGCSFLIIKLNTSTGNTTPTTISLLRAIDYSIKRAIELAMPLVINLSFGNNYGDHGSNSILEDYIDSVSGIYKLSIIVGSGNDGRAARHHQFMLGNLSWQKIDFVVNENQGGINLQIWRNYADYIDILMQTPSGKILGPFNMYEEIMTYNTEDMIIKVIYGYPSSINRNQETYISIIPRDTYIEAGIWNIFIKPKSISNGRVDIWLPVAGSTSADVRFLNPTEFTTLTIPSTARKVITVGAYNSRTLSYAAFSGRGYTINGDIKPDLSAPGVDIDVALPGGGYGTASGTSFATPFVSAAAAIMMEYGIVEGNDLFLYGEKLKAYLINGAKKLPGYKEWPNELLGWGALCLKDSLP